MSEKFQSASFYEEPTLLVENWNDKYVRIIINPVSTVKTEVRSKGEDTNETEEVEVTVWNARTLLVEKPYTEHSIIEALIRTRYTISDELGLLRQRETKPDEFQEYNTFVEECKNIAHNLGL